MGLISSHCDQPLSWERGKLIPPTDGRIKKIFNEIGSGKTEIAEVKLLTPKNGVTCPKELLGYDLILRDAQNLNGWRSVGSPEQLLDHMTKNGYTPIELTIRDRNEKHKMVLFYKDNHNIVHAVSASIVDASIFAKLTDPSRFEDKKWIFNYQEKVCASVIKPGRKFYDANTRIGLILAVQPRDIVEVFPRDKLSPVGFRKSDVFDNNVHSEKEIEEENKDIQRVKDYVQFQKNYRSIVFYCDAIATQCLAAALSDPELSEEAYALLTSLTSIEKEMVSQPLGGSFHASSGLTQRLTALRNFVEKHQDKLASSNRYSEIFQVPEDVPNDERSILKELNTLVAEAEELDSCYPAYNQVVLARQAAEWGAKWGHKDTSKTTAYLSGKMHGISAVTHENIPASTYSEINVQVPKRKDDETKMAPGEIEIAGLLIDVDLFDREGDGSLSLDLGKVAGDLREVKSAISREEAALAALDPSAYQNINEYQAVKERHEKKLKMMKRDDVSRLEGKQHIANVIKRGAQHNIPILCTVPQS